VDLLVVGHEGVAGERVIVLPAGERAHAPDAGVDGPQPRAVAHPPDHPLVERRRDLPAVQHQPPVGVEDELRVVDRAVVALVHTEDDHGARGARGVGHRLDGRPRHGHRFFVEAEVLLPHRRRRLDERKVWVVGDDRLGEDDQRRPLPRRRSHGGADLVGGPLPRARAQDGRELHGGRTHFPRLGHA